MPVAFLTPEQEASYGHYQGDLSEEQLRRYFYLSDADLELINAKRGDHNRLGCALQLTTLRFLGTFLEDPAEVPQGAKGFVTRQLGVPADIDLGPYRGGTTRYLHAAEIKAHLGYRELSDPSVGLPLVRFLYTRSRLTGERSIQLFDLATAWLAERKVLLPGATVLERLVARVRERASQRLWAELAALPTPEQVKRLEDLLVTPGGARQTPLDRLRRAPRRISGQAMREALLRVAEVHALGVGDIDLSHFPAPRLRALSRYAATVWAGKVARLAPERRVVTLLAFAQDLEKTATDDALDLFSNLMADLLRGSESSRKQARLKGLKEYDKASLVLADACTVVLEALEDTGLREAIFKRVPRSELAVALHTVHKHARPPEENFQAELIEKYLTIRRFLNLMLTTVTFGATEGGRPILDALEFLAEIEGSRKILLEDAPVRFIGLGWQRHVYQEDAKIDKRAYTLCAMDALTHALKRRDVFVVKSARYGDPRAQLLAGEAWQALRADVCRSLDLSPEPGRDLERLSRYLHEAYHRAAAAIPSHTEVRIEKDKGKDTLLFGRLEKLDETPSLERLSGKLEELRPTVELPELLLEIDALTDLTAEFTHVGEAETRAPDIQVSVCAVLLAEACNIGFAPLLDEDVLALTEDRLSWVQQNYVRLDTLAAANASLVDYQATLPLAQAWGGGEVASVDGLRFVVPIRTLNAGPNPKYFGIGRGVTYLNMVSDQYSGLHGMVVQGTVRDSLYVLDGLLEQQTSLEPIELITDTAGYTDPVFGLYWLLGYQFSPLLADIGEARYWRLDRNADYGVLNGLARNRINTRLILENWDDLLRVAGSLKLHQVRASDFMRTLLRTDRPASGLAKALAELGKISKTLFLLALVADEGYRRHILMQRNRHEGRHSLARAVFHGKRGELRKPYREGQEDQLGALGLVVNAITLWNTIYTAEALSYLEQRGETINPEDVARLSPLSHSHINFLGRYRFALPEGLERGKLRPLRSIDSPL